MPSIKPLTLRSDSDFLKVDKYTLPLSACLALRIYSDTQPFTWKTADLQKGLIYVCNGEEVVGEGTGFGVPVLEYSDETYFSGSADVYLARQENLVVIRKDFFMDKITRNTFRNVRLEKGKLRAILRYMSELYQNHKHLRFLLLKKLSMNMGVHATFVKATPVGKVIVTYGIGQGHIRVKADFSFLQRENLQKIFMLNEQGSRFFRRYSDSNDATLADGQIGAWDPIEAEWASITDVRGIFGFSLEKIENRILRRGREFLNGSLDWVGLNYEINPTSAAFEYDIEVLEA